MNVFTQHLDELLLNRCSVSIMIGPDCSDEFKSFIIQKYEEVGYRYIALGSRTKASELVAIAVSNEDSVGIIVDNWPAPEG